MKAATITLFFIAALAAAQNPPGCLPGQTSGCTSRIVTQVSFTSGSSVVQEDEHVWYIGVEGLFPPPNPDGSVVTAADLNFQLPPHGTITKFQGTFGMSAPFGNTSYTSCTEPNAALGLLVVDGKRFPVALHFDSGDHRDRDVFFNFDIPLKYTSGSATVHIEANPMGCWSDVELQGKIYVNYEPQRATSSQGAEPRHIYRSGTRSRE